MKFLNDNIKALSNVAKHQKSLVKPSVSCGIFQDIDNPKKKNNIYPHKNITKE